MRLVCSIPRVEREAPSVEFACSVRGFFCPPVFKGAAPRSEYAVRPDDAVEFPSFRLDLLNQQSWRDTELLPLRRKPLPYWRTWRSRARRPVPRGLGQSDMPETHVGAAVLRGYIRDLSLALADDPDATRFIETLAHRGFRIVESVTACRTSQSASLIASSANGKDLIDRLSRGSHQTPVANTDRSQGV